MRSNRNSLDDCVDGYCFSGWLADPCEAVCAMTFGMGLSMAFHGVVLWLVDGIHGVSDLQRFAVKKSGL